MPETETIEQAQQNIVAEFGAIDDWEERYRRIIQLGKSLPEIDEDLKQEKYIVKGCQSTVWLVPGLVDGRVHFQAGSDAMIVRGLIALLMRVYNDRTPDEIASTAPHFINDLGLNRNLTQGRANGLASMIDQIKLYGVAFKQLASTQQQGGT